MEPYRIFISSTIEDLTDARRVTDQSLSSLEIFSVTKSEDLPAANESAREVCLQGVAAADAVVLLLGARYGFVPATGNPQGLSVTHLEYRHAKRLGIPVFPFVHKLSEREPQESTFLAEVENFETGSFRNRWESEDDLARKVQRSLLWWLAKKSRQGTEKRLSPQLIRTKLAVAQAAATLVGLEEDTHPRVGAWASSLRKALEKSSREWLVPTVLYVEDSEDANLRARVSLNETSNLIRLEICGSTLGDLAHEDSTGGYTLLVEVGETPAGIEAAKSLLLAFLLLEADDPNRSAEVLIGAAELDGVSEASRGAILCAAGAIGLRCKLENAIDIGRRIVALKTLTASAFSQTTMTLFVTAVQFERLHLSNSKREVEKIQFELLSRGLREGACGPEAIYSLARKVLLDWNIPGGVQLYYELVRLHPYYESRWYWHRDLGVYSYQRSNFKEAACCYDTARRLKPEYSRLHRFAGDAFFYQGKWAAALERYRKAVEVEPTERYFLDIKIAFAEAKASQGATHERSFGLRRRIARWFSGCGSDIAEWNLHRLARGFFGIAHLVCEMDYESARWRALYANRRGDFDTAVRFLVLQLATEPENAPGRLNLAANLIFRNRGKLPKSAESHLRAAIFHGGASARDRFSLQLMNTSTKDELLLEFERIFSEVQEEWKNSEERRLSLVQSEEGGITHVET